MIFNGQLDYVYSWPYCKKVHYKALTCTYTVCICIIDVEYVTWETTYSDQHSSKIK